MTARCTNDTDGDGDCAACVRNPQALCRMTARETLTTTLTNLLARTRTGRMDAHRAEAERLVGEVLNEHAHRLAEEAREFVGPREYPGESERITRYVAGWHDAIDRMDLEVGQ